MDGQGSLPTGRFPGSKSSCRGPKFPLFKFTCFMTFVSFLQSGVGPAGRTREAVQNTNGVYQWALPHFPYFYTFLVGRT